MFKSFFRPAGLAFFLLAILMTGSVGNVFAQDLSAPISPERKAAIDSLALEKVRDLSKYITIIGNKKNALVRGQSRD
jgi:hypothetical protein